MWAYVTAPVGTNEVLPVATEPNGAVRVITSTIGGDDGFGYPTAEQTHDGRVRVTYRFRSEFAFLFFYDPTMTEECTEPDWETEMPGCYDPVYTDDACGSYSLSLFSVNLRLIDPPDGASYAESPDSDDNDWPEAWGIEVLDANDVHLMSSARFDPTETYYRKVTLVPKVVGTTESLIEWNRARGIPACVYEVQFDLVVGDGTAVRQHAGDNYAIEVQVGMGAQPDDWFSHLVEFHLPPECSLYVPEFRDEVDDFLWNSDQWNNDELGPFEAWARIYCRRYVSLESGAELAASVPVGSNRVSIWEAVPHVWPDPMRGALRQSFVVGDRIRIFDLDSPAGETAVITHIVPATVTGGGQLINKKSTLYLDRVLTGSYKHGYPNGWDINPAGRGAALVLVDKEEFYWPDVAGASWGQLEESLRPFYIEIMDATAGDAIEIPYPLNFWPWSETPLEELLHPLWAHMGERLSAWAPGYMDLAAFGNRAFALVNGGALTTKLGWAEQWVGVAPAAIGDFTNTDQRFAFVAHWSIETRANQFWGFPDTESATQNLLRKLEFSVHEIGHVLGNEHCSVQDGVVNHPSNIHGTGGCIMTIQDALLNWWSDAYRDGITDFGHMSGEPPDESNAECYSTRGRIIHW